jgi:dienelactone hydrolase
MNDHITIKGQAGAFGAYIARPKTSPAPAVVVLQELFGVNADIRKHCDNLAEQGFIAAAPDLFWRQESGVDLSVTSEPDWQHGLRLYLAYNREDGAGDVKDTADAVAKMPECTGKVAVLGYCLGGLMTFLTAVRYGVDAAVVYHGGDTEKYLGEADKTSANLPSSSRAPVSSSINAHGDPEPYCGRDDRARRRRAPLPGRQCRHVPSASLDSAVLPSRGIQCLGVAHRDQSLNATMFCHRRSPLALGYWGKRLLVQYE